MLKPQDIVVAARLALSRTGDWSYGRLADELGMSSQTVFASVRRLAAARLYNLVRRRISREDFLEFAVHGLRFAFPAQPRADHVRGVPTGAAAPPLSKKVFGGEPLVWPDENGKAIGRSIAPLHPGAPRAAADNPELHEILALIDALRIGGAREREAASQELRARVS